MTTIIGYGTKIIMTTINEHSGKKYLRRIFSAENNDSINVDVYQVTEAFKVTCGAIHHAIKKLLCAGLRGKNDTLKDLEEARDAISRAIDLHKQQSGSEEFKSSTKELMQCNQCMNLTPILYRNNTCLNCFQNRKNDA